MCFLSHLAVQSLCERARGCLKKAIPLCKPETTVGSKRYESIDGTWSGGLARGTKRHAKASERSRSPNEGEGS